MFRKKKAAPRADIDSFVPGLQGYLREHYVKPKPKIKYCILAVERFNNSDNRSVEDCQSDDS